VLLERDVALLSGLEIMSDRSGAEVVFKPTIELIGITRHIKNNGMYDHGDPKPGNVAISEDGESASEMDQHRTLPTSRRCLKQQATN